MKLVSVYISTGITIMCYNACKNAIENKICICNIIRRYLWKKINYVNICNPLKLSNIDSSAHQ